MTPSPGPIQPHHAGSPSRVIQGFFTGGRPRIVQASPAPVAPARPQVPTPVQARPGSPPAPVLPGRPATGALQPALRPCQPPRPILPTQVRPGAVQPATPLPPQAPQPILPQAPRPGLVQPFAGTKPQMPQPILPQRATPAAVQPHAGDAFPLPGNFTLKPRGSGQPLPEPVQKKMEAFFNTSFADVRVHVGHEAPSIGALAFTHGTDLYFAPGQYNPQSTQGQQLLGHELTHVLQQRAMRVRNPLGAAIAVVQNPALVAEAERMGLRAAAATAFVQTKVRIQPRGINDHKAIQGFITKGKIVYYPDTLDLDPAHHSKENFERSLAVLGGPPGDDTERRTARKISWLDFAHDIAGYSLTALGQPTGGSYIKRTKQRFLDQKNAYYFKDNQEIQSDNPQLCQLLSLDDMAEKGDADVNKLPATAAHQSLSAVKCVIEILAHWNTPLPRQQRPATVAEWHLYCKKEGLDYRQDNNYIVLYVRKLGYPLINSTPKRWLEWEPEVGRYLVTSMDRDQWIGIGHMIGVEVTMRQGQQKPVKVKTIIDEQRISPGTDGRPADFSHFNVCYIFRVS